MATAQESCAIPPWLDPSTEVTTPHDRETPAQWTERTVDDSIRLGIPAVLAFDAVANLANETAHGALYRAWNFGGVKAGKGWADAYRAKYKREPPWWRAFGNVGSGDAHCVYYRGYASRTEFLRGWYHGFVPKPALATTPEPAQAVHKPNYSRTGWLFWHRDSRWFGEMIEQGYKGEVTRASPGGSIREWEGLRKEIRNRWVQSKLGLTSDGVWGTASQNAARAFQQSRGLPVTGEPDDALVSFLSGTVGPEETTSNSGILWVGAGLFVAWLVIRKRRRSR